MAMALHVNSWVLLGVVADGCPMDILERRDCIACSILIFEFGVGALRYTSQHTTI